MDSTAWHFAPDEPGDLVPIGLPLSHARAYVVDAEGRQVPIGVTGELHVGGIGLARGYAGRGDLTADRFVPDPDATVPGERRYGTGDLVRRRADGALEYVGRVGDQVKIGGVRIEPGEIEVLLAAHPSVAAAVVAVHRSGTGDARLTAYAVPVAGERIDPEALRAHLAAALPEAMLPAACVELAELPLTPNGKADRRRLVAADEPAPDWYAFQHPLTAEALLAQLTPTARVALSEQAADAIETLNPGLPGDWCPLAATLRADAGDPVRAGRLFTEAGRRALADGAVGSAVALLDRAERLLAEGGDSAARANGGSSPASAER